MATFSKRHYEALAEALRTAREQVNGSTHVLIGVGVAQAEITALLAADNPAFDGERFARASGMRE